MLLPRAFRELDGARPPAPQLPRLGSGFGSSGLAHSPTRFQCPRAAALVSRAVLFWLCLCGFRP